MADEAYWSHKAATPTPSYEEAVSLGCFKSTEAGWYSLTPGMRREIIRSARKQKAAAESEANNALILQTFDDFEHADKRAFLERKADVERAGRERF